jgi:DNA invertase Pin-like site-specific DNA recombinase
MKKGFIIARCSTNEEKQDVTRQTEELLSIYSNQYKIEDSSVYSYYESGTKNDNHNSTILKKCIDNGIDTIIVSEVSRIGRKMLSVLQFIEECNKNSINVHIHNPNLQTLITNKDGSKEENPIAKMLLGLLSSFAEMELNQTMERLNSGRKKYIKHGGKLGRATDTKESNIKFLSKHADIIAMLERQKDGKSRYTIRDISLKTNKSTATIMKVKKAI